MHRLVQVQARVSNIVSVCAHAFVCMYVSYHVLPFSQNAEKRVMPLLDVDVEQASGGQRPLAGRTHVSVERVIVMLIVLHSTEHLATARYITPELTLPERKKRRGGGVKYRKVNMRVILMTSTPNLVT